jgi:hypothetical protein
MGLFNSTVLDVIIGVVFVYLLLAIMCTTINEWIAGVWSLRAKNLAKGIQQLLDQQPGTDGARTFLEQFYAHPLISSMLAPGKKPSEEHPSYLPARTFATVVMDLATSFKPGAISFADLENGAKALPAGDVRTTLLALIQNAGNNLDRAQKNIEQYFDNTMERVSGWYKRRTQIVIVVIATLLTVGTNADTLRIGRLLWTNSTLRAQIVERAKSRTGTPGATVEYPDKNKPLSPVFKPSKQELADLSSLLGWAGETPSDWRTWPARLLGWFLSIVAISLGAPFWFDTLNRLMNVRNAGRKPEDNNSAGAAKTAAAGSAS